MAHPAGHGLFVGAALAGVALVLITEGLSLGGRLTPGWLGASWALAGAVGVWAFRRQRVDPRLPGPVGSIPRGARWVIGAILTLTGAIALLSPPNTWDSMTYHMPRVAHWSQAGSVAHYPTHVLRQLWLGPGAEFAITHLYLLAGGDRLANLVQWLAFVASVLGSAIVAAELGGGPRARALAALACATLPMAIAQASSTQNDLVASFWMLSLGYGVLRFRASPSVATAALVGASAGLAGLTKLPVGFVAVPWLLAFGASAWRVGRRRAVWCIGVAALSAVALNLGHVGRTVPLLSPGGPSPVASDDVLPPSGRSTSTRRPTPGRSRRTSCGTPRFTRSRRPIASTPGWRPRSSRPIGRCASTRTTAGPPSAWGTRHSGWGRSGSTRISSATRSISRPLSSPGWWCGGGARRSGRPCGCGLS